MAVKKYDPLGALRALAGTSTGDRLHTNVESRSQPRPQPQYGLSRFDIMRKEKKKGIVF